ncbi:MAG: helix-turn-helix transcriptional regulator, partial [Solirubrobacteraceae bacterium]
MEAEDSGWASLFWQAFKQSRNAMVLLDERRCIVDVNGAYVRLVQHRRAELLGRPAHMFIRDGPLFTAEQWRELLAQPQFTGSAELIHADGSRVTVDFAGHPEIVTGQRLILVVALRIGRGGRRPADPDETPKRMGSLSPRECDVVRLLSLGSTGPEIADELHVAHNTVRTHVRNAMTKLGAR